MLISISASYVCEKNKLFLKKNPVFSNCGQFKCLSAMPAQLSQLPTNSESRVEPGEKNLNTWLFLLFTLLAIVKKQNKTTALWNNIPVILLMFSWNARGIFVPGNAILSDAKVQCQAAG